MKNLKKIVGFVILLIAIQSVSAQSPFLEEIKFSKNEVNEDSWNIYNKIKENKKFKNVIRVKINNLKKLQKEGKLSFKIPGQQHKVTAYPTYVYVTDEQSWEWNGELLDKNEIVVGSITLISEEKAIYGSILAFGEEFILQDVGLDKKKNRIALLIQHDPDVLATTTCASLYEKDTKKNSEKTVQQLQSSCNADVRVLVMYTTKAYDTGISPSQVASTGISNMNQALRNSGITSSELTFTLAGVQRNYNLDELGGLDYKADLTTSKDNESLRNLYRADLVITLTDGNYYKIEDGITFNYYGYAGINDPISLEQKYGLVEIDKFNTNTFVHELGHLLGGWHENDPDIYPNRGYEVESGFPPDCGFYFKTIMHHVSSGAVPHFSNPTINYNGCATGKLNRNVTDRILLNRCEVYNFNTDNSDFQVYINGPSYVYNTTQYFTWTPQVTGCSGSITGYTWAYSTNGYAYTNFSYSSTASKRGDTFPYGFGTIFIKLTVNCSNGEIATRVIQITNYSFNNYAIYIDKELMSKPTLNNAFEKINVTIFPNPASSELNIKMSNPTASEISVNIFNEYGLLLDNIEDFYQKGFNEIPLNINGYKTGLYYIQIVSEKEIQTHPIIIQK